MSSVSASHAPKIFSAPLIASERSPLFEKIFAVTSRAFKWIRSLFSFIIPLKKEIVEPLSNRDVQLAQRALQIAQAAKPNPIRFIRSSISQGIIPAVFSLYQRTHSAFSAFVAKRIVDTISTGIVMIANAFFPAYSDALKQGIALTLCAPVIWIAADRLGYQQGYLFFLGIGIHIYSLGCQVVGYYQTLKLRQAQREALAAAMP